MNFSRRAAGSILALVFASPIWAAPPDGRKHIDDAIFKAPLETDMALKISKPVRKGSCSIEATTARRQKDGIACEDHFTESAAYLGVTFDSLIFTVTEEKRLRRNLAFSSEGPCAQIFETFTMLAKQLQKAKLVPKMQAMQSFLLGDMLMIPSAEISSPGIESNSAAYFKRVERADANGVCRVDLQINPPDAKT